MRRFGSDGTDLGAISLRQLAPCTRPRPGSPPTTAADGRLYVATDVSAGSYPGIFGLTSVQAYDPVTLASATATAATDIAPVSATLNGSVNPEGGSTGYHFEYSSDGGQNWTTVDPDSDGDEDAGDATTDVAVSETATGLAENTHYRVRVAATKQGLTVYSNEQTFTTTDAPDPTTSIAPATAVTATSATVHGTVNPQGGPGDTSYRFEYSSDGGTNWAQTPDQNAGDGTADANVTADLTDLLPAADYRVRLIATKGSIASTSGEETFTTDAVVPTALTRPALSTTHDTARLSGQVNPQGSPTTYHFEYGTTTAYGERTPADDIDGGSGRTLVDAVHQATSLQPTRPTTTASSPPTRRAPPTATTRPSPPKPRPHHPRNSAYTSRSRPSTNRERTRESSMAAVLRGLRPTAKASPFSRRAPSPAPSPPRS